MHKRGQTTSRITSGEQLQHLNRKSSPGSGEHCQAFTGVRILSGQRRVRAPVFTGASLWVVLLWWHHQRDQREQGSGPIKREEAGYLQREREARLSYAEFLLSCSLVTMLGWRGSIWATAQQSGRKSWRHGGRWSLPHGTRTQRVTADTEAAGNLQELDKSPTAFAVFSTTRAHQCANTVLVSSPFSIKFHRNLN